MITIEITEEVRTPEDMAQVLEIITPLVRRGVRAGIDPTWKLVGEPDESATCAECGEPMFVTDNGIAACPPGMDRVTALIQIQEAYDDTVAANPEDWDYSQVWARLTV